MRTVAVVAVTVAVRSGLSPAGPWPLARAERL